MTKVSRLTVPPKSLSLFIDNFWSGVTLLENKTQVKEFFKELLSPTEGKMLAKRLQVCKMLLEGHDYRTIQNYIKVTPATIARISNQLHQGGNGLKAIIERLWKIEKEREEKLMRAAPGWNEMKNKYPAYFLPEIILEKLEEIIRKSQKRKSALIPQE